MELDYCDLVNPYPIKITGIGKVRKPKLSEIFSADIGYSIYQSYIAYFVMSPEQFIETVYGKGSYSKLSNEQKNELNIFDLQSDEQFRDDFLKAISFFIDGKVEWYDGKKCFLTNVVREDEKLTCDGIISRENFEEFSSIIAQISNISLRVASAPKFKSQKAREIWEAAQRGKKAREKRNGDDKTNSIPNVVSKLSIFSCSYNMTNIWDLTVYQLYDQFSQLINKSQNDVGAMNYSVWGGKFDITAWFKANKKEK